MLLSVHKQGDAGISSAGIAKCHEELTPFFSAVHLDGDGCAQVLHTSNMFAAGSGTTGDFPFLKFIPFPLGLTSLKEFHGMIGALSNQGNQTLSDLRVLIYYIPGFPNILNQVEELFFLWVVFGHFSPGECPVSVFAPGTIFPGSATDSGIIGVIKGCVGCFLFRTTDDQVFNIVAIRLKLQIGRELNS